MGQISEIGNACYGDLTILSANAGCPAACYGIVRIMQTAEPAVIGFHAVHEMSSLSVQLP